MLEARVAEVLASIRSTLTAADSGEFTRLCGRILSARRVFLLGAGQTGLVLRMFAMRLAQAGLSAHLPGDCTTPAIERGDLLLAASRSGERAGVLALAGIAATAGANVAVITESPDSALMRLASSRLILPVVAPSEHEGTPPLLGTRFEMALQATCLLLTEEIVRRLELDEAALLRRHANLE